MRDRCLTGFALLSLVLGCSDSPNEYAAPVVVGTVTETESTASAAPTQSSEPPPPASTPPATVSPVPAPAPSPTPSATVPGALPTVSEPSPAPTPTTPGALPTIGEPDPDPGEPTCGAGVQTGTACNPTADTEPCVRTTRSCECGVDATWTCSSNTGAGGAGPGPFGGAGGAGPGTPGAGGSAPDEPGAGGSPPATVELDCDAMMPTSGGTTHSNTWQQGGEGNLAWQIWTNGGPGSITVYDGIPAFTATWNNSGDYLGRMGFEWGNAGRPYTDYGTIKADYVWNKTGTAGQYSYIGIYGWSTNPCVEWYIVEDSFHQMPFNTGDRPVGTADVDGGTYNLVYRHTQGTGGDRCGGAGSWDQFYSIRLEGKRCGTITVSDHFDVWAQQGWNLGSLLEVKIVVEAAAGTGSVDFPIANVTTSQ